MKSIKGLRNLPVMNTGNMDIWWDNALDNWDELCYEESCYDGESRPLPELPKQEEVECYVRVDVDDIKTNSSGRVNLERYICAFNSFHSITLKNSYMFSIKTIFQFFLWKIEVPIVNVSQIPI